MKYRSIKSTETRNNGITAKLSEKIPTLAFNSYNIHANVGIFSLSYAVLPSFLVSVLFIIPTSLQNSIY